MKEAGFLVFTGVTVSRSDSFYAAVLIAIIFFSLALLIQAPPPVLATSTTTTVTSLSETQAQQDSQDIPAEKVDRFAAAYLQVLQLNVV